MGNVFTNEAEGKGLGSGKETTRKERSVGGVLKNGRVWRQFFLEKSEENLSDISSTPTLP